MGTSFVAYNVIPPIVDQYFASNTLLLHFNGVNGTTNFIDSSSFSRLFQTSVLSASHSTTQKKFGTSSLYVDGSVSGAGINYNNTASQYPFNVWNDPFTIEFWLYPTTNTLTSIVSIKPDTTDVGLLIRRNADTSMSFFCGNDNSTSIDMSIVTSLSYPVLANQWTHVAFTRVGLTGYAWINGVLAGQNTAAADFYVAGHYSVLYIGRETSTATPSFSGYIDDFRITKGVARYTANFAVPTAAFPDQEQADPYYSYVKLLLHCEGLQTATTFTDSGPLALTQASVFSETQTRFGISSTEKLPKFGRTALACQSSVNNNSVTWATSTDWDIGGGNDFTIEVWAQVLSVNVQKSGWISRQNTAATLGWYLGTDLSGTPQFAACINGTMNWTLLVSSTTTTPGTWNHLAVVRNSGTLRLYVNGIQTASAASPGTLNDATGEVLQVAKLRAQDGLLWDSYKLMDEIRFTQGVCRYPNGTTFTPNISPFPSY
jgi:hypothetical protein